MMPLQESPSPSWQLEDYAFFRKCGEITASPDVQSFGFNCAFCPAICLQFSVFMDHIRVQHTQDVSRRYETEEERSPQTDLVIMELDCPEIYPPEEPRKLSWEADMDIQLMSFVPPSPAVHTPTSPTPPPPPPETAETPEIDLVYVVENPLPPSPPPSADISGDELAGNSSQSFDLDPFAVLHEVVTMTPPTPIAPPPGPTPTPTSTPAPLPRYETRRVKSHRELERNHEFVGCLLRVYERTEKLWNPGHPDYKYNAKRSAYGELAGPLEAICHRQLSASEIFAVLKELRGRFRRELKKVNALGGKYKSRLWYFDKMLFLRRVIENRRAEKESKMSNESTESERSCETDADSCGKSSLYHEVLSFILDAFKRQECLWNPQHYDYTSCCKTELFRDISAQLQEELNYELSGEECCNEIQKLRTRYRKELRMVIKHKGLYLPKLWCYDEMEFLQPILQEQIFNKISKKVGVVGSNQKTKFIDASSIRFDNSENQLQFVEIYHNYSALWDVDHPDFRSNAYRSQALGQMLDEINTTFHTSYSAEQLEKTLFNLRKDFSAQKRKILTESEDSSSIPLLHAKLAEFLDQNLGPFRCDVCSDLIKTCDQYKVHRSAHDGTHPFICTLCGKGFQMPCNLTVHIRRHRRDFPYSCEQCDKRFATSTEVAIHLRTHTGERPYICDLCGKSFKTWSFFDIHRRRHLNQSTFHCPICAKGFYEKNRFTDHMNSHWAIRKHLCTVCGKTFTTYGNLKKHTELHLAVKKYKCSTCGKRFAQFASLRWHKKREHSSEGQADDK
ncbi:uncharacterized protein LOC120451590 isoform X2 [Drosophila santomea]|uniref:uncharacterized protein LOC120451590 isoform X2 n=1 Tax=Drosophila santomea TaxID=129105 RepID=UPI001954BA51|nr:uncharacterized protein LOC120451590 isoform X2 [Drosophila santomea]